MKEKRMTIKKKLLINILLCILILFKKNVESQYILKESGGYEITTYRVNITIAEDCKINIEKEIEYKVNGSVEEYFIPVYSGNKENVNVSLKQFNIGIKENNETKRYTERIGQAQHTEIEEKKIITYPVQERLYWKVSIPENLTGTTEHQYTFKITYTIQNLITTLNETHNEIRWNITTPTTLQQSEITLKTTTTTIEKIINGTIQNEKKRAFIIGNRYLKAILIKNQECPIHETFDWTFLYYTIPAVIIGIILFIITIIVGYIIYKMKQFLKEIDEKEIDEIIREKEQENHRPKSVGVNEINTTSTDEEDQYDIEMNEDDDDGLLKTKPQPFKFHPELTNRHDSFVTDYAG
mmetsp:Transcript_907/g.1426  ORF Transcript_907/g.1426 Transcript_907/m.1426 type:complete len:352 (+) Transcript_907:49-1104(+)